MENRAYSASSQAVASFMMISSSCRGRPLVSLDSVAGKSSLIGFGMAGGLL